MENTILLYTDKPVRRGKSSLAVKLPMIVCKRFGIGSDTEVRCYLTDNSVIFRFGDNMPEKTEEVF